MQKRLLNKKGISPLIATVLLIAATIGIFLIVFALIKGNIVGTIEKSTTCGAQEETSIDISAEFTGCDTKDGSPYAEIIVKNNGQIKVEGYMFVFYNGEVAYGIPPSLKPTKAGEQRSNQIKIKSGKIEDCPDKIEVYPGIVKETSGKAKFVVCKNKKVEVIQSK